MGSFLLYVSLALVVLWTVRLAMSKRRSPWLWGSASLALWFIPSWPSPLLGMVPMVILLFLKAQQAKTEASPSTADQDTCSRCNATQPVGQRYCTSCGWELRKPHLQEGTGREEKSPASSLPRSLGSLPATTSKSPAETADAVEPAGHSEAGHSDEKPVTRDAATPDEASEASEASGPESPVETEPVPRQPAWSPPPTAAGLTQRGLELFNEGRYQRAIDQFTKAIALDPNYREAWAHRAESYARLGREKNAAEDRRHLQAIEASQSVG